MRSLPTEYLSKHFECILDSLPDGLFISDPQGTTVRVNRMYEHLTGLTQESLKGKNVRALVEEGVFDYVLNPEIVATGKPATHVQTLRNGKQLVLSGFPVFNESGKLVLVVTFARDTTLLMQMSEQMTEQRRLIEQMNGQLAFIAQEQAKTPEPVFESPLMTSLMATLRRVAETDATVLILGETGVGKDVFGRLVHSYSHRHDKMLLKVDCGGISETLTESEMFGYMPGAFTGASSKGKAGYFEIADGGTVFLDEIGELPLAMQSRLLRVLQDGEIVRVGSSSPRNIDVRIIAATNRDLSQCVDKGTFRRDLYYRLNVAILRIPPLRERPEDIRPLARQFLQMYTAKYRKVATFMDVVLEMLTRYSWPGNVRELQNLVHSLVITHKGPLIAPRDLPSYISGGSQEKGAISLPLPTARRPLKQIMAELERDFLLRAIEEYGSIRKVADLFQINRSTIFRKIQECSDIPQDGRRKEEAAGEENGGTHR
ncbi:MAG: sigma 54-interacting transcriptional regulator [Desulfovibrio sp.]|jgi:PAS domain S-box-containing protein|nr:sigma 54-interacting transcriptional regulator [Desulfovibrio sp.]